MHLAEKQQCNVSSVCSLFLSRSRSSQARESASHGDTRSLSTPRTSPWTRNLLPGTPTDESCRISPSESSYMSVVKTEETTASQCQFPNSDQFWLFLFSQLVFLQSLRVSCHRWQNERVGQSEPRPPPPAILPCITDGTRRIPFVISSRVARRWQPWNLFVVKKGCDPFVERPWHGTNCGRLWLTSVSLAAVRKGGAERVRERLVSRRKEGGILQR